MLKIPFRYLHSASNALVKTKLSYAKSKWEIVTSLANLSPSICWFLSSCVNKFENASTHIINKYGERGHPCLKPLSGWIKPFGTPLIITKKSSNNTTHYQLQPLIRKTKRFSLFVPEIVIQPYHTPCLYLILRPPISSFSLC